MFTRTNKFARPLRVLPAVALCTAAVPAPAHEIAGNRFFPATLAIDDPGVNDEVALPTVAVTKSGDEPPAKEIDISGEYVKRLTDALGLSVAPTWKHFHTPGAPDVSGFDNVDTALKYRLLRDPVHELVVSVGLDVAWGGSGAKGVADPFSTYTPTVYFGKGFGDLPDTLSWARPFAVTGQLGYAVPGSGRSAIAPDDGGPATFANNPQFVDWGLSLQYSLPYLKSAVYDVGLPDFVNHLIPVVEASFQTPAANTFGTDLKTIGTVNPGIIYVSNYYQIGIEAIIPINRDSGRSVGAIAQLHVYLDDLMPTSLGKPLFGGTVGPASPF